MNYWTALPLPFPYNPPSIHRGYNLFHLMANLKYVYNCYNGWQFRPFTIIRNPMGTRPFSSDGKLEICLKLLPWIAVSTVYYKIRNLMGTCTTNSARFKYYTGQEVEPDTHSDKCSLWFFFCRFGGGSVQSSRTGFPLLDKIFPARQKE